jgi:type I restriction enzyme M protein
MLNHSFTASLFHRYERGFPVNSVQQVFSITYSYFFRTSFMDHATHNKIVSFIWSIADDCLRDVFVRGKYRDVILPMFVLRRIDCLLEDTKDAVLGEVKFQKTEAKMAILDPDGLREASGQVFYNTSQFTLKSLLGNPSQLEANFNYYLDGFSENVAEIIAKFDLRNQIRKMAEADALHGVI